MTEIKDIDRGHIVINPDKMINTSKPFFPFSPRWRPHFSTRDKFRFKRWVRKMGLNPEAVMRARSFGLTAKSKFRTLEANNGKGENQGRSHHRT